MKFLDNIFTIIDLIPDMTEVPVCPSLFSDNQEKHDCDSCEDKFDCKSCWKEAIINAEHHERIERLREAQDKYAVDAYYYAHRTTFVEMVSEFIGYLEIDELKIRPNVFVESWNCESCRNRWIFDDYHDPDACLECFNEAITEAYKAEIEEA